VHLKDTGGEPRDNRYSFCFLIASLVVLTYMLYILFIEEPADIGKITKDIGLQVACARAILVPWST
jgi:DNA-directed RNA polymerase subunit N (RpoN/RPB10)